MIRYYCIKRPPMVGQLPLGKHEDGKWLRLLTAMDAFDKRRYIPAIGRMAWGWVEYSAELTPHEIAEYGLIREPREVE